MGVQGLWSLVGPAARPTQLESLRQKRIAVDASIWIHQFMRTMRDKEGNALRNGHLLGFFRRICKLLFFDIKPVFVFDGGAPTLKRSTIRERRKRREGVKANLKATAKKILSAQVKSRILFQEQKKLHGESNIPEKYTYYDELETSAAVETLRKKHKMDQFELPEVQENETDARLRKLDPRLATSEEIQDFVNEYKPTEQDIDSEEFQALPPEIQYEVIQDMMWKSRSTSWARLDEMVRGSNTALDFSKHQIKLLKHRNAMTQRLMQASSAQSGIKVEPARIAGERGRQYILYKNEDLNQGLGWKLPGLTAAEPVNLDDTTTLRPEPKLEVPDEKERPSSPPAASAKKDKVAAALASNPKLAALFDNFLSDDDEEEDAFENVDTENLKVDEPIDEDAPLFLSKTQGLINDMSAYVYDDDDDDEAMNQAISRMYSTESGSHAVAQEDKASHLSLNPDEFYEFWVSRAPDAFMYMHSFNDEYKKILKRAIEEQDPDKIKSDLLSIRKQFGKTNEANELALETLQFKQDFLESVIEWRAKQAIENEGAFEQIDDKPAPPVELTEDTIMIDDDDDDEEIQFTTGLKQGMVISDDRVQSTESILEKEINYREKEASSPSKEHVHIDIHQSTLPLDNALDNNQALVNNDVEELELADKTNGQKTDLPKSNDEGSSKLQSRDDIENKMITESSTIVDFEKEKMDEPTTTTKDHGYNSEEELDVQGEEDEFARFVSDIQSKHLDQVRTELYQDMKDLNKQQRKEMGNSDDVTDQMVQDIQELLKLFGVPYIVSPMEAEAQCAALETLTLVDGTITDDSDVFLFGASRVFKNMFNQQRFVECYMSQDIEREMSLSRKKLIQLAFLLGSDYTEGIPGVGPVAAMEILAEFGSEEEEEEEALQAPLERFKNWYNSGIDTSPFQKKFRKRHSALDIPDDFPNPLVIEAYYHPTVDDSTQKFEWGQPQLDSLRIFLMEAFGWSEEKADQVLLPVLREMNNKKTTGEQTTIGSFFNANGSVSSSTGRATQNRHSSKRVQSIVDSWKKQKRSKTKK